MENKVNGLIKQNESIYNSLKNRNVPDIGDLIVLTDDLTIDNKLELLNIENNRLKELVKNNKPPPIIPQPKPEKVVNEQKPKVKEVKDDNEDEEYIEPVAKFSTLTNMEDIKRAFFTAENNDYSQFIELVKNHNFKLYKVNYKYSSDKDGAPSFSAKNLVGGFVRNFDDLRKYFMICFRCFKNDVAPVCYSYPSYWIVNSEDPLEKIIGSLYEDFEFTEIKEEEKDNFYIEIQKIKIEDENLITEAYVH
jgi:hypothetical protein